MLTVAPISISYASVRVFSRGVFGAVLSGPSPVPSFFKVCHLGAWWFRGIPGDYCFLPVIRWVKFSLSAVASPFLCWGGGGGERGNYYLLLLCTAVTLTID